MGGIQKNTAFTASTNLNILCDVDLGNELLCCLVLYRHALLYWIEAMYASMARILGAIAITTSRQQKFWSYLSESYAVGIPSLSRITWWTDGP